MKKKVLFSLLALMAIVFAGFSIPDNATPIAPKPSIFKVEIDNNHLIQRCGLTVILSFSDGTQLSKPYTGAGHYYFDGPAGGYNGTVCANVVVSKLCSDIEVGGECINKNWLGAPTVNTLKVTATENSN